MRRMPEVRLQRGVIIKRDSDGGGLDVRVAPSGSRKLDAVL